MNELYVRNRRLLAERLGWPDGALGECENLDLLQPGWRVRWQNAFLDKPAGYYASHPDHTHLEPDMYGSTPGEVFVAMETHRCPNWPPRSTWMP